MNQIIHEIIVFSIALTLPTYFVRVIDKTPKTFKHYLFKLQWWWAHRAVRSARSEVRPDDY